MSLGITCIVYRDVCLRYKVRKNYCSRIYVSVGVSVNECAAQLADSREILSVGTL